ncbi:hypothetical protein [Sporosarcina highlanderae]|uniref:DUF2399 domain-containing protein n=1 Tax=Sporosarcina highlanderae TaxID=3035916 RepID=A0ABT8JTC7_9BACL|nr:hypothetical protein [Sporosarcina highlanderae]MDN4608152.1 hypothetical protein [Sporosarcina highlanderae]
MQSVQAFLETIICKAGESVRKINEDEWEIQRWTARTYRTIGIVIVPDEFDVSPSNEILKLGLKPNSKKKALPLSDNDIQEALIKGWIVKEIRFSKDGRTPISNIYRMGPGLFAYEELQKEEQIKVFKGLNEKLLFALETSKDRLPEKFIRNVDLFVNEEKDAENWGRERVLKFTHFLIAFLQLKRRQSRIEYKEIGATYYEEIGGSKVFDGNREVFISRMEKWIEAPIAELGIVSTGFIVPIFFTGNMRGNLSSYSIGTVHATTEISVSEETFRTDAKNLWLVENRGVLTKMAAEKDFLIETSSLVIGVDGQIRGAHRKLIQQLCESSSIQQVVIWVDYDNAGTIIARELSNLVEGLSSLFIGNEGNVFTDAEAYSQWVETVQHAEQEMTLGGPIQWKEWIGN